MKEEKIPISLITGFLGSGKTTVINHLLTTPALAKTAVLVNEFGQISIDSDLIRKSDDSVVELRNGCVCCSLNDDLGTMLHELTEKRRCREMPAFEKVVIETTGLANAGPIIAIIMEDPLVRDDYALDKVITTVDSINGVTNLNIHAESVEQVAVADRLILTKLDRITTSEQKVELEELRERIRKLNPSAETIDSENGRVDADILFRGDSGHELFRSTDPTHWVHDDHDHGDGCHHGPLDDHGHEIGFDVHRHDHNIKSFCIVRDNPVPLQALDHFWSALAEEGGLNLLRVKGIVHVAERPNTPAVVQGVQQVFDEIAWLPAWPSDDRRTRLVFIGWMIDEGRIGAMWETAETGLIQ